MILVKLISNHATHRARFYPHIRVWVAAVGRPSPQNPINPLLPNNLTDVCSIDQDSVVEYNNAYNSRA